MIKTIEGGSIVSDQRKKIHPHKFALWVAMASIVMMFAGLTSAYIVKREQPGWTSFNVPRAFWYSTAVILASSLTIQMAVRAFKQRNRLQYRNLVSMTVVLGVAFIILQWIGFKTLWAGGIKMTGSGGGQFLYIIAGLHALHVLGGVIALFVLFIRAFNVKIRSYNSVPVEVVATYWHFVDLLWLYLFIFFSTIQ